MKAIEKTNIKSIATRNLNLIIVFIVSALINVYVAFINGYPLVDSDSGAYLNTGAGGFIPNDRPPFYGWFINFTSFKTSLWYAIIIQSFIVVFLLHKYISGILDRTIEKRFYFINVLIICSFTCISWISSFLMPDIYGALLLLVLVIYLTSSNNSFFAHIGYLFLLLLINLIHNSHFIISLIFSVFVIVYSLIIKNKSFLKKSIFISIVAIFSYVVLCSINLTLGRGFTYSQNSNVFLVSRLAEMGLLKTYLDDNCGKKNLRLCPYKDQIPARSWEFMWTEQSPLARTGGWDSNKVDNNIIVHDIFTTPAYSVKFLQKAILGTLRQFTQITAPDFYMVLGENSSPSNSIKKFYSDEHNEYKSSWQNTAGISATTFNIYYNLFFVLSCVWILFHFNLLKPHHIQTYMFIVVFLFINAFVTSAFSTILNRYQNRVFWVLPATNAIFILDYYWKKYGSTIYGNSV